MTGALVEQDAHLLAAHGHIETSGGEFKHCFDLLTRNGKLLHKFLEGHPVFQILKHGCNRHASSFENPSAAYFAGDAFDGRAQ